MLMWTAEERLDLSHFSETGKNPMSKNMLSIDSSKSTMDFAVLLDLLLKAYITNRNCTWGISRTVSAFKGLKSEKMRNTCILTLSS